jgi:small subunit ribosomal protein S17
MTNTRRRLTGTVVSTNMTKTVVVRVDRTVRHPLYGKVIHRSEKFMAHDENGCQTGDRVKIVESKPLSARKRWVVEEIILHKQDIKVPTDSPSGGES